jgi:hypothetical protein
LSRAARMRLLASRPSMMWAMAALSAGDRRLARVIFSVRSSRGSPKGRRGGAVDEEVVGGDVEDLGKADDDVGGGGHLAVRARRPRVRAVHPQPALQLRQPQLRRPPQLPLRVQARPQRRGLRGPVRQQLPQPRVRSTQPRHIIRHGLLGHAPQAPTATARDQIDTRRTRNPDEKAPEPA